MISPHKVAFGKTTPLQSNTEWRNSSPRNTMVRPFSPRIEQSIKHSKEIKKYKKQIEKKRKEKMKALQNVARHDALKRKFRTPAENVHNSDKVKYRGPTPARNKSIHTNVIDQAAFTTLFHRNEQNKMDDLLPHEQSTMIKARNMKFNSELRSLVIENIKISEDPKRSAEEKKEAIQRLKILDNLDLTEGIHEKKGKNLLFNHKNHLQESPREYQRTRSRVWDFQQSPRYSDISSSPRMSIASELSEFKNKFLSPKRISPRAPSPQYKDVKPRYLDYVGKHKDNKLKLSRGSQSPAGRARSPAGRIKSPAGRVRSPRGKVTSSHSKRTHSPFRSPSGISRSASPYSKPSTPKNRGKILNFHKKLSLKKKSLKKKSSFQTLNSEKPKSPSPFKLSDILPRSFSPDSTTTSDGESPVRSNSPF